MAFRNTAALAALSLLLAAGMSPAAHAATRVAIFAGGCFWSTESDLDKVPGVLATVAGYIGGNVANPTYDQVLTETTGHREAVRVVYDNEVVTFRQLTAAFLRSIDPFDPGGQMFDRGQSYTTAIYAVNDRQLDAAAEVKAAAEEQLNSPLVTLVALATPFYPAEEYHQNYYQKNPEHYYGYREASGRFKRVVNIWGDAAYEGFDGMER